MSRDEFYWRCRASSPNTPPPTVTPKRAGNVTKLNFNSYLYLTKSPKVINKFPWYMIIILSQLSNLSNKDFNIKFLVTQAVFTSRLVFQWLDAISVCPLLMWTTDNDLCKCSPSHAAAKRSCAVSVSIWIQRMPAWHSPKRWMNGVPL